MIFWFFPSFFSLDLSSAKYILWVYCCIISHSYHLPDPQFPCPHNDWCYKMVVPKLFNQLYLWGVYCCVLLLFPTILSFYCWVYLFRSIPIQPLDQTPHVGTTPLLMYIVILFWFAIFWLIAVLKYNININQWVHQRLIVYHTISSATNDDHEPLSLDTSGIH